MKTARIIIFSLGVLLAGACGTGKPPEKSPEKPPGEEERLILDKALAEIVALAKSTPCASNVECRFVGVGSKACGGHVTYLTYPASIDTVLLLKKVSQYTAAENAYNTKWGVVSDCLLVMPPPGVACVNGICTGYPE